MDFQALEKLCDLGGSARKIFPFESLRAGNLRKADI
jgi:hypothetical protein